MTKNDDTQQDLNNHGIKDIIPPKGEYYTLDLKRGNDTDINDLPKTDMGGNNPLSDDKDDTEVIEHNLRSTSSNAGGAIRQKDIINQNADNGVVPGEPGHVGIDEDTG